MNDLGGGTSRGLAEHTIGESDFRRIADLVHKESGIALTDAKRGLVVSRLTRRLRHLNLTNFTSYCDLLDSPRGESERDALIAEMTTNVTRFFREEHHFQAFETAILPGLTARARSGERIRIWSAGCSTGEEAYSIAMALLDRCPEAPRLDIGILATDINPIVLETAREGRYQSAMLDAVPPARRKRYFDSAAGSPGISEARDQLRGLVTFEPLNLVAAWPMRGLFDVVFCRNVAIYFDAATQERLWARFASVIRPGGTLFIGHSETMPRSVSGLFDSVGTTQYRRTGQPSADHN